MKSPQDLHLELDKEILLAVKSSNISKVCYIITNNIIAFDADNMSIPAHAISCKKTAMLQCLLDCGYNVNAINANKRTLLHEAVISSSTQCLQLLLSVPDINLDGQDLHGWTPLFWAVNCGNRDIVKKLITVNADLSVKDHEGNMILHRVADSGCFPEFIEVLVHRGCDIDCRNSRGETPLMVSAAEGYCNVISALLDLNADINLFSDAQLTPLLYSVICENLACTQLLILRGASLEHADNDGNTAILHAVSSGNKELVYSLMNSGCKVAHVNNHQHTALHIAGEINRSHLISLLLESNVNPKAIDHTRRTALSLAAQHGNYEALLILAEVKSTLDINDLFNYTPLHWAIAGNYQQCVRVIYIYIYIYMCSILTKQSACRQLLVCVLLFYLIEYVNTNI